MSDRTQVEIVTYLQQAKLFAEQAQWSQTIATCQQIIDFCRSQLLPVESDLTTPEIQLQLGDRALAENNLQEAIDRYRSAVSLAPHLSQANQKLAEALSQQGRWAEATPYYRRAIELKQTQTQTLTVKAVAPTVTYITYKTQGDLLHSQGQTAKAIEQYLQAIKLKSDSAELFANLGSLYAGQQQWQSAIQSYQQALQIEPKFAGVCRNLAKVCERIGESQLAADYWYRALSLEPSWGKTEDYFHLAYTLYLQKKSEPAIDCYLQAIALKPNFTEAYIRLAILLSELEQFDRALNISRQLATKYPRQPEVYLFQGRIFGAQKQWQEAISACETALKLRPNCWEAYHYLAETKIELQLWEEVITACQQAIAIKPDVSWIYHHLGYASLKLELYKPSEAAFREAIRLNGNFPWSYVHLGEILGVNGRWLDGIDLFLRAIELNQSLPGIYKQLGIALYRQFLALKSDLEATINSIESIVPLKIEHQTTNFYRQIAQDLSESRQYMGATIFYGLALRLEPGNSSLAALLAEFKEKSRQLELKIAEYRENIQLNPNKPWMYSQLANILADRGEAATAISLNRQASVLQGWHLALEQRNYHFQYDWFSHNIPIWRQQLQPWCDRPIKILEIGSFEGMATCWLLDYVLTHPEASITCIDLYFQNNFARNIAQTHGEKKVIKMAGDSHKILATLEPSTYDIIYIDGCHLAEYVKQDAILSWKLLKSKGLLIFDDYLFEVSHHPEQNTKLGIDDFLASISNSYQIRHQGYQLSIEKH
jgi:tetratricopeptide (TPR) repeat protein